MSGRRVLIDTEASCEIDRLAELAYEQSMHKKMLDAIDTIRIYVAEAYQLGRASKNRRPHKEVPNPYDLAAMREAIAKRVQ